MIQWYSNNWLKYWIHGGLRYSVLMKLFGHGLLSIYATLATKRCMVFLTTGNFPRIHWNAAQGIVKTLPFCYAPSFVLMGILRSMSMWFAVAMEIVITPTYANGIQGKAG